MTKTYTLQEIQQVCAKLLEEYKATGMPIHQITNIQLAFLALQMEIVLLKKPDTEEIK